MLRINTKYALTPNALLGVIHALLLLPILTMLMSVNHLPGKRTLILFFILTQVSALILTKAWLYFTFQSLVSFLILYWLFPSSTEPIEFRARLLNNWSIGVNQWHELMASEVTDVPDLLLMTGVLLLVTLLTFFLIHLNLALPSFSAGLIYLMTLHTFTSQRILFPLVFLTGFGLILISLTQIQPRTTWSSLAVNSLSPVGFTIIVIGLSYFALDRLQSSQEWVETKSNAYQQNLDDRGLFDWINRNSVGLGFSRTGMGTDDSELGGRLQQDFTLLFEARTRHPHYWKVLHRMEYTGVGWESNNQEDINLVSSPYTIWDGETVPYEQRKMLLESEKLSTVQVEWFKNLTYLAYPYGWADIQLDETDSDYALELNNHSGYLSVQNDSANVSRYTITYDRTVPDRFDEEALTMDDGWRDARVIDYKRLNPDNALSNMNNAELFYLWFEEELRLPRSLPQRVVSLAEEITRGLDSEYAMVRAIELHLKEEGGYRYSLLDVESTPDGADYVDHFLFESQVGYCDNFSTSMVILLRALGIPARWTKGFTPGRHVINAAQEESFIVNNSNAHSWPEVYFPSYGWIPFEPSPSFANPATDPDALASVRGETYSFDSDDTIEINEGEREPFVENEAVVGESTDDTLEFGEAILNEEATQALSSGRTSESSKRWRQVIYTFLLSILLLGVVIAIFRWHTVLWLVKILIKKNTLSLKQATYLVLRLYYLKQKPMNGQTLALYYNEWKPYAPNDSDTFDAFCDLANSAFYSSKETSTRLTSEQKDVLIDMLTLFASLPRVTSKTSQQYYRSR